VGVQLDLRRDYRECGLILGEVGPKGRICNLGSARAIGNIGKLLRMAL
jgi:hypothetical protein